MAATERALPFRGDLQSLLGSGNQLTFTSTHAEGRPTAVWRLDVDQGELKSDPLPTGATALIAADGALYAAGSDGVIYSGPVGGGAFRAIGAAVSPAPRALAALAGDRLAALSGQDVVVLRRKDGVELQRLSLGEDGTALAADPSGRWLVAGTSAGSLVVYDGESRPELRESERGKPHEGAVTALMFEPSELRVLSCGADAKLLSTHVRGRLEPEDRGGRNSHEGAVRAILFGRGERFYTTGKDATIKVWETGVSRRRPATVKDGVPSGVALALVELKGKPQLAIAGEDATLRLFQLDAAGKVGEPTRTYTGAVAWARAETSASDAARREAALKTIATWGDAAAIDLLASRATEDADHALRVLSATLLGQSGSVRARAALERLLQARDEAVRRAALTGLRALEGETALRPLDLAIQAKKADIGIMAVDALVGLAKTEDQALSRLVSALDTDPLDVRVAALMGLEQVLGAGPEANLQALRSARADVRRLALVRCFQRKLLDLPGVQAALRRHGEDADADVRSMAFLVSVRSRPRLADALRHRDRDLHRQLHELETYGKAPDADDKLPKTKEIPTSELGEADLAPLMQAMASRALDTCLRGAGGLASLQDVRAMGSLLQLSRDPQTSARVAACKALAALGDARATNRLRTLVRDGQAEVRDAAFTALARLLDGPLPAASAGLGADHDDVRRRGLEILVREIRRTGAAKASKDAIELLARTLDDAAPGVRSEAFKAALNLGVDGGAAQSLRFCRRSIHADVRREVLVEVEGQIAQAWAPALLLELFQDPDPGLRKDAFEFASKRAKASDMEHLAAALGCRYPDLRVAAATALAKRHTAGARDLLVRALDDEEASVRRLAVDALVVDEAAAALAKAMASRHADVRVRAAMARAAAGDRAALAPLLAQAREAMPETGDKNPWLDLTESALGGLGALGDLDEADLPALVKLVDHPEARIRKAATRALATARAGGHREALLRALQHADTAVRLEAAYGLACNGHPEGASLIFAPPAPAVKGKPAPESVPADRALLAAVGLGDRGRDQRLSFLDHNDKVIRERALLMVLLSEWMEKEGQPDQCLAALSSAHPRTRLLAARALEPFCDPEAFSATVVEIFNDRGEGVAPWTVSEDVIRALATALVGEHGLVRVRAAEVIALREATEQAAFDRGWRALQARYNPTPAPVPARPDVSPEDLRQLVFGAYVGLARLKAGAPEIKIQQTALSRLAVMVGRDAGLRGAVIPVYTQALTDPHQIIRRQAFEGLKALGVPAPELGAEALSSEHRDVGALGLALLSEAQGGDAGASVLEGVLLDRVDGLEEEALKLLLTQREPVGVLSKALGARSTSLRDNALSQLVGRVSDPAAVAALRGALSSRFRPVRFRAAEELATLRDGAGWTVLLELLASDPGVEQGRAIRALARLGDPRAPGALLDRIDTDPAGTAAADALIAAVGETRSLSIADRLFGYLAEPKVRGATATALLAISGYDQPILDEDEDTLGRRRAQPDWEARQRPRTDALLVRLLEQAFQLADARLVRRLIPGARWSRSPTLGEALVPLLRMADDDARHEAIEALGWRLRHRKGDAAPLLRTLEHPDVPSRFYAAESLALAGRKEGVVVLLACIDTLDDMDLRRRAVSALGKLGDPRALDTLLRIVETEGHALQEPAAEAIGHLRDTPRAGDLLALLRRLSEGDGDVAQQALSGLRWFGGADAWKIIRDRAEDDSWRVRQRVAQLLGYDDAPQSREVLVRRIREDDDSDVVEAAFWSLRRLVGPDSLEPDYAILLSQHDSPEEDTMLRLGQRGDAGRLLDLLPQIDEERADELRVPLEQALLARTPLPVAEAAARLLAHEDAPATLATRILGRSGAAGAAHQAALVAAVPTVAGWWTDARDPRNAALHARLDALSARLSWLCWACGRISAGADAVLPLAALDGMQPAVRQVRGAALGALAEGLGGDRGVDALVAAARCPDPAHRALAAGAVARLAPAKAAALAAGALDDPGVLARLSPDAATVRGGLSAVHTLGVALPYAVRLRDVAALAALLADKTLPETVRLGAAEGLGRIGTPDAITALAALGKSAQEDETLRKAAWRAIRRARRIPEVRP